MSFAAFRHLVRLLEVIRPLEQFTITMLKSGLMCSAVFVSYALGMD